MHNEMQRIWKETGMHYIKVLFQYLLGQVEENHKNPYHEITYGPTTQSDYDTDHNIWKAQEQGKGMRTGLAEPTARTEMSCAKPFISSNSRTLTAGSVGFVGARRIAISMCATSCSVME
jgi:hypothetical protein